MNDFAGSLVPFTPEIDTACVGVPCTRTLPSMMTSVGAELPEGSKSIQESVLGGVISM
jgi:hypothetical protein